MEADDIGIVLNKYATSQNRNKTGNAKLKKKNDLVRLEGIWI